MTPHQTTYDFLGYLKCNLKRQNAVKTSQWDSDARLVFIVFGAFVEMPRVWFFSLMFLCLHVIYIILAVFTAAFESLVNPGWRGDHQFCVENKMDLKTIGSQPRRVTSGASGRRIFISCHYSFSRGLWEKRNNEFDTVWLLAVLVFNLRCNIESNVCGGRED